MTGPIHKMDYPPATPTVGLEIGTSRGEDPGEVKNFIRFQQRLYNPENRPTDWSFHKEVNLKLQLRQGQLPTFGSRWKGKKLPDLVQKDTPQEYISILRGDKWPKEPSRKFESKLEAAQGFGEYITSKGAPREWIEG